jgi:endoplasmic reticulum-Golgi intermediate compartment protein 3
MNAPSIFHHNGSTIISSLSFRVFHYFIYYNFYITIMGLQDMLRHLDSHSSVSRELRVYTIQGAVLSVITVAVIVYLFLAEWTYNFQTVTTDRVHVNATSPTGLDVEFDITFPQIPCSLLNIDANDPSGQTQSLHLDLRHHVWKHRVQVDEQGNIIRTIGNKRKLEQGSTLLNEEHLKGHLESIIMEEEAAATKDSQDADNDNDNDNDSQDQDQDQDEQNCGSCYGAGEEGECCNTCDDVKRAYKRKAWHFDNPDSIKQCQNQNKVPEGDNEGCNVHGLIALDSGGGSFHLAPGRNDDTTSTTTVTTATSLFEMLFRTYEQFNVTHTIHKIRFGKDYPGTVNQLDGQRRVIADGYGMYQYYFKVRHVRHVKQKEKQKRTKQRRKRKICRYNHQLPENRIIDENKNYF